MRSVRSQIGKREGFDSGCRLSFKDAEVPQSCSLLVEPVDLLGSNIMGPTRVSQDKRILSSHGGRERGLLIQTEKANELVVISET